MPLYEHVFLARQDASAQQVDDLTNQFKGIVEGLGGKVEKTEYWGVKSLTYRMNKNRKAHFTLMNLDAPAAAINEIERQERLSEDVLRYITIRVEELEEGPSAMMRKAERDDRDRDGRGFGGGFGGGFGVAAAVAASATVTAVTGARAVIAMTGRAMMLPYRATPARRDKSCVDAEFRWRTPPLLSSSQDLPVHWRQCAEDRLQGREAVAALRLRARQDRAKPHHCRLGQEAA